MNRLFTLIIGLFGILPVFAMEPAITKEDNLFFAQQIKVGFDLDKRMIKENKISENNPMCVMLDRLNQSFSECGNDIPTLIKKHSLQYRLDEYAKIDFNPLVQVGLKQINVGKRGSIEEARDHVIKTRKLLAQLELQKKQPNFGIVAIGGTRLDFLLDNQYYPVNDVSFNDYVALGIYRTILSKK